MRAAIIVRKALSELIQFAVVLIGITFLTFSIMFLSPKNPAELWLAGSEGNVGVISEEAIREQEKIMGLDKPFMEQYTTWLGKAAHGDLGVSFTTKRPVTEELIRNMSPTLRMTVFVLIITVAISLPIGILCAVYRDRLLDNIMRIFSFFGISMPSFLLSLIFLWFFCIKLRMFPVLAQEGFRGLILPSAVLVIQCSAKMIRQIRGIVLEQLEQPYVDGAVTRGVKFSSILFSHVLKNCAASILSCIGLYVGILIGGSTVIEGIFSVNGLGRLAVSSVARMDQYVVQGFVLLVALGYLIINLIIDILSAVIDPRIKYSRSTEDQA